MIGIWTITPEESAGVPGTRYTAAARHWTEEDSAQHEAMGFADGWVPARISSKPCARAPNSRESRRPPQQLIGLHHALQPRFKAAITTIAIRVIAADQFGITHPQRLSVCLKR